MFTLKRTLRESVSVSALEALSSLTDLMSIKRHLRASFKLIGSGEWRDVYDAGSMVIKVVKDDSDASLDHNANEVRIARSASARVPLIIDTSKQITGDYEWIAVERVTPLSSADLDRVIAQQCPPLKNLRQLRVVIEAGLSDGRFAPDREAFAEAERMHDKMCKSCRTYKEIFDTIYKNDLRAGEELHDENWGVRANGDLVLLDAGE